MGLKLYVFELQRFRQSYSFDDSFGNIFQEIYWKRKKINHSKVPTILKLYHIK